MDMPALRRRPSSGAVVRIRVHPETGAIRDVDFITYCAEQNLRPDQVQAIDEDLRWLGEHIFGSEGEPFVVLEKLG